MRSSTVRPCLSAYLEEGVVATDCADRFSASSPQAQRLADAQRVGAKRVQLAEGFDVGAVFWACPTESPCWTAIVL